MGELTAKNTLKWLTLQGAGKTMLRKRSLKTSTIMIKDRKEPFNNNDKR